MLSHLIIVSSSFACQIQFYYNKLLYTWLYQKQRKTLYRRRRRVSTYLEDSFRSFITQLLWQHDTTTTVIYHILDSKQFKTTLFWLKCFLHIWWNYLLCYYFKQKRKKLYYYDDYLCTHFIYEEYVVKIFSYVIWKSLKETLCYAVLSCFVSYFTLKLINVIHQSRRYKCWSSFHHAGT